MPMPATLDETLQPLRDDPARTGVLCDVDGTLAPIVERPEDAAVPAQTRELLERLAERYALVACVSGRRALDARRLVAVEGITYVGNHGLERVLPGEDEPRPDPALDGHEVDAEDFIAGIGEKELASAEIRVEDKGAIQALHWRGARNEGEAESHAHEIASDAEWRGLRARWGRKVLEIRPPLRIGKGDAIAELLGGAGARQALYGGDDLTDVEAFLYLRKLREGELLETAVCVGVASSEGPPELRDAADLMVEGPQGFVEVLRELAA
jgi:trehalose 6-phosphate phosphatase